MKVRIFNNIGNKNNYIDYDFDFWKSMYGFEFAGTEEFNIYKTIKSIFINNHNNGVDNIKTIENLTNTYNNTAWSYYIGDFERFVYLMNKAKDNLSICENEK